METIGVIGTGAIGSRFVTRLREAGITTVVHDVDRPAAKRMAGPRVQVCHSAAEVAGLADIVVTCVTDPAAVQDVCLGTHGIVQADRPANLLIETTTSLPGTTATVAGALEPRGVAVIDAPVSRGVPAAEQGTLSIMVGGDADTYRRALPVLGLFGTDIVHVGPLGAGHVVKLLNMQLMAVQLTALIEATWLARCYGTPVEEAVAAFDNGLGRTYMTSNHFPKFVHTGTYASQFTLDLMHKDLDLAVRLAHEHGIAMPLAERAMHLYRAAEAAGLSGADNMRLVPFWWSVLGGATPREAVDRAGASPPKVPVQRLGDVTTDVLSDLDHFLGLVNLVAAREVLAVSGKFALDDRTVFAIIDKSSGRSRGTAELAGERHWPARSYPDAAVAATEELAHAAGIPLLVGSAVFDLCRLAAVRAKATGLAVTPLTVADNLLAPCSIPS